MSPSLQIAFTGLGTILADDGYYNGSTLINTWSTTKPNKVESSNGLYAASGTTIDLGSASNTLKGKAKTKLSSANDINLALSLGFVNAGSIKAAAGNDELIGDADAQIKSAPGGCVNLTGTVGLANVGSIDLGDGKNNVSGKANSKIDGSAAGLANVGISLGLINLFGAIKTGTDKDTIDGNAKTELKNASEAGLISISGALGLSNLLATIDTGAGDDRINGTAKAEIETAPSGSPANISLALGLLNLGGINTGAGKDTINGKAEAEIKTGGALLGNLSAALGLLNIFSIDTGSDNDKITGEAEARIDAGPGECTISGGDFLQGVVNFIGDQFGGSAANVAWSVLSPLDAPEYSSLLSANYSPNLINGSVGIGLLNGGLITMGEGNDAISGKSKATIKSTGTISILNASIAAGMLNAGAIDLGGGSNSLEGSASASTSQKQSLSLINAGLAIGLANANPFCSGASITAVGSSGEQKLTGKAEVTLKDVELSAELLSGAAAVGIANGFDSSIDLGNGDTKINGSATATATSVNTALFGIGLAAGLLNAGSITTGSGKDVITGSGSGSIASGSTLDLYAGIANFGTIATGAGNDIVDALIGGFYGCGTVDLGADDDILKGFGSGAFLGGDGEDLLTLNNVIAGSPVTYTVSVLDGNGFYQISDGLQTMNVSGFEKITTSIGIADLSSFAGSSVSV